MPNSNNFSPNWSFSTIAANQLHLNERIVDNVITLLDEGSTIPFIARYRKEKTNNIDVDQIREIASTFEELRSVEQRIQTVCNSISKVGKLTKPLETSLRLSTSILEVDTLYAPFKPGHKGSLAERARANGLEPLANNIIAGQKVDLVSFIKLGKEELSTVGEIEKGIQHIIADIVAKDKDVMDHVRILCEHFPVILESSKGKAAAKGKDVKVKTDGKPVKKNEDPDKFQNYFDFRMPVRLAKPHMVLAINRGEDCKALSVKITIPDQVKSKYRLYASNRFLKNVNIPYPCNLIRSAILDAYDRLIEPMVCRHIRSDLTKSAEKASISVFSKNLKHLLLSPPMKNKTVLGIDPGFRNGCKVAVISTSGTVLETDVLILHDFKGKRDTEKLVRLVKDFRSEIITIGNGVACRETEQIVSDLIKGHRFKPVNVAYCIVDECGASIYSVSDQAKQDLPNLDPSLRGAVSIARRLLDPLAEFVKIEPQHLGVGMYQHDLNKNKLQTALSSVVEECVSFVGVDLNTCSECLLRRVSGLNVTKAKNIIEFRNTHGAFINRQQLLDIKGLGKKGFEQCAGFVRILHNMTSAVQSLKTEIDENCVKEDITEVKASIRKRKADKPSGPSAKKKKSNEPVQPNPFDATAIHPESYDIAIIFLSHLNLSLEDVGSEKLIHEVKRWSSKEDTMRLFCERNDVGFATLKQIVQSLMQSLKSDYRDAFQKPIFKVEVRSASDLQVGNRLTGRVTNVTHFGAFVDIGVGTNGLIHTSQMGGNGVPETGNHVEVVVQNFELARNRISLSLVRIL